MCLHKALVVARKEWGSLLRERTLILAIIIQLFMASFSSFVVVGLTTFYEPEAVGFHTERVGAGVVGNTSFFDNYTRHYGSLEKAYGDFYSGRIHAILTVPDTLPSGPEVIYIDMYLPKSDVRGTMAAMKLKEPLSDFESHARAGRGLVPTTIYVEGEPPAKISLFFEFLYGVVIPLLVITPVMISGGLIIDTISEEYERKTVDLLLVSPLSMSDIANGKIIAATLIAPAQVGIWLALVSMNGVQVYSIPYLLWLSLILTLLIVILGACVAMHYRERASSQYVFSQMLVVLFLLGAAVPDAPLNLIVTMASGAGFEPVYTLIPLVPAVCLYVFLGRRYMQ
ncbi:MAG TPA: ABC transporter permease [Candidatus Methanoperedenaceae archaeon]|nr:ABC transporter permease [Candidatus Methanoperedenaceae archaeon]